MGPLVVLAYSGGLDTSAIVPWLREKYGARVLCFAADVGQGPDELTGLVEKAKRSGAVDCVVQDLREEFVRDFVFPTLRAGAVYARTYLLGTAMRSEEHTSELQSQSNLVCRLLLEKKKTMASDSSQAPLTAGTALVVPPGKKVAVELRALIHPNAYVPWCRVEFNAAGLCVVQPASA